MSLETVRCRGCGRSVGLANSAKYTVYCDSLCAEDYPLTNDEERDDLILALTLDLGRSRAELSALFGITRQRVDQIVHARKSPAK